jgi:tRNA U34 2-thiouridine synthase MnmA/TrmU
MKKLDLKKFAKKHKLKPIEQGDKKYVDFAPIKLVAILKKSQQPSAGDYSFTKGIVKFKNQYYMVTEKIGFGWKYFDEEKFGIAMEIYKNGTTDDLFLINKNEVKNIIFYHKIKGD